MPKINHRLDLAKWGNKNMQISGIFSKIKMPKIIGGLVFVLAVFVSNANASYLTSQWNGLNAYAAPCLIAGDSGSVASQCSTWCKNQYSSWVDNSSINFVTVLRCDAIGISSAGSNYIYCCVNNSVSVMVDDGSSGCLCPGEHRTTMMGENDPYPIERHEDANGTGVWEFECRDMKCFCENDYYGATKKLSQSTSSDTCTECPCMPSGNYTYGNQPVCGVTYNSGLLNGTNRGDDSKAPASSTINTCYIQTLAPSPYGDLHDTTGTWRMDTKCNYSN